MTAKHLIAELSTQVDPIRAKYSQRFFKTGILSILVS